MKLVALIFILLVAGCDARKNDTVPNLKMNSPMKTQCIGHSLIDLPDGYALKSGAMAMFTPAQDAVESATIDLVVKPVADQAEFVALVKGRHTELAAVQHGDTDKLTLAQEITGGGMLYRVQEIDDAYQSEVHWLLADQHLSATIHSYKNQVKEAELLLLAFMKNITYLSSPTDVSAAFCFSQLAVGGKYRKESATLHFKSTQTPDIAFSVDVDTFRPDEAESLLQRVGGPNSLLRKFQVNESVLRKGEVTVAGMRAQEWGAAVLLGEDGDQKQLAFTLETMRPFPSPAAPQIHLEMEVKGSRAGDQSGAVALWNSVVKTIRQR
jgi:hypothetical protein